ncbi:MULTISPECIES: S49 family peptidase [Rhizobium]|uniref:Signal peptide peptidase SppA n=1 Tax=Rhizobium lentis TaxID=1138194 RepID=A0A7W8UMD8_9HYPH|nr:MULTISPECIES: S49 family peptidase [Rhizobium]MBB4574397.1 signal peptide peptidase SppA [Rhizobium lentis]MBB5550323.1 signal peptide peptidase SppA [Rhizobium lentis]MBB5560648.1 signal peptide peptidase SppA [Rhizobium lentis]MBB5567233.1 signal peptide peptidase SppA [Rhizobium lentis]
MTTRFPHLRAAIMQQPWAIMPERLEAIAEVIERRVEGIRLSPEEIAAIKGERRPNGVATYFDASTGETVTLSAAAPGASGQGASVIAVISFFGIVAQHASQVDDISGPGGTSTERVTNSYRAAKADPSVKAIVINFDSPGGNVSGVQALADEIFNGRGDKPVIAQVNSLCASAAYWVASSCDEIVMTPGAMAGSIGVYSLHQDVSRAVDAAGLKFTFISAGKYKVEGNAFEPLSDEAAQAAQSNVDAFYNDFVSAVSRGRGVSVADVKAGFGEGRVVKDKQAVKAGMADRVDTLDGTIRRLSSAKKTASAKASAADVADIQSYEQPEGADASADIRSPEPELPTAEEQDSPDLSASESDAFRRRRHAHRLRSAQ